jgi:hypothetical protein
MSSNSESQRGSRGLIRRRDDLLVTSCPLSTVPPPQETYVMQNPPQILYLPVDAGRPS